MRIDLFSRSIDFSEKTAPARSTGKGASASSHVSGPGAELTLGAHAKIVQATLAEVPEVRKDRVAALRAEIQQGRYSVPAERTADALFAEWSGRP
jgi:flagellar biosynthesis anti-sigma factor FlgM